MVRAIAWSKITGLMVIDSMKTGKSANLRTWHRIGWRLEAPVYPSLEIVLATG